MTKISERWKHNGITEGYCNICGKYGLLTKDHVPPKCAITLALMNPLMIFIKIIKLR